MKLMAFASQIALRSQGASTSAVEDSLLALGNERSREAEKRGEDDRYPQEPFRGELGLRGILRKREVEDDERGDDEQQHGRHRVPRTELEEQILASEDRDVLEVGDHATSRRARDARSRAARCAPDRAMRRPACEPRRAPSAQPRATRRPPRRGRRTARRAAAGRGSWSSVRQSASRCCHPSRVRRDGIVPGSPERVALEQHADPLSALRDPVETSVQLEVLEGGQLAVDQRLVAEVADRARSASTSSSPPEGARSPANSRNSVLFPEPFRPVTSRKPPFGSTRSTPRRTCFSPKRLSSARATITRPRMGDEPLPVRPTVRGRGRAPGAGRANPSRHAPGEPGRLTRACAPTVPAMPRERTPCGGARSRRPGSPRRSRAPRARGRRAVASGVTSRGATPVPPVVSTSRASSASSRSAAAIASRSSGTTRRDDVVALGSPAAPRACRRSRPRARRATPSETVSTAALIGSFVFSSSRISSTTISASIAFAMS